MKRLLICIILLSILVLAVGCSNLAGKANAGLANADATATAASCASTGKFCLWTSMCCRNNKCLGFACRACYPAGTANLPASSCLSACCSGKCGCTSKIGDAIRCTCQ